MSAAQANGKSARTGSSGRVVIDDTLAPRMKTWQLNASSSVTEWGDSDSEGYTNRKKARKDATGALTFAFDDDQEIYTVFSTAGEDFIGQDVELVLWETINASEYWVFPCSVILSYSETINMDTKEVIEGNFDWGSNGKFYRPRQTGAPAHSPPSTTPS